MSSIQGERRRLIFLMNNIGAVSTGAVQYYLPLGVAGGSAVLLDSNMVLPFTGRIIGMYVQQLIACGALKSRTYEPLINSNPGAVQVIITGATQLTGNDLTHTLDFVVADRLTIRNTPAGVPAATRGMVSLICEIRQ